jgi:predicted permease
MTMMPFFRKVTWWLRRRQKEDDVRDELQFHLSEETDERGAEGLSADQAAAAARRDLGNVTLVREDARALWSWVLLEQMAQDLRYGVRAMFKNRMFTALAALSLALGIGANTAIYSFMDSILLRSLPVSDPASLVVMKWRSRPVNGSDFVMHGGDGSVYADGAGRIAAVFPFPAFEHLRAVSAPILSSLFAHKKAGNVNVRVRNEAELVQGEYVTGGFFDGLAVVPTAGRLIHPADDLAGATPVAVLSMGYSQSRFGSAEAAAGQAILVNNVSFTVIGVAPPEFFGVDPAEAPQIYLPMQTRGSFDTVGARAFSDPNFYWVEIMGRLRPGVDLAHAQATLAGSFNQWVTGTADDQERQNLPVLSLEAGAGGLDSLRRQYSKPLYVLLSMVGLILAIACANTANLLLARASARKREIAVRLSLGAGRWRVIRQLLTESVLLASLSGALGVIVALFGIRVLTRLLANGRAGFTLHAELNWHVLGVTLVLSVLCGMLFGLVPAMQSTRPSLMPILRDRSMGDARARLSDRIPRVSLMQVLVVAQIAISLLLLVGAGLFVRTLSNLQSISLGFTPENVLLFDVNAPQAGLTDTKITAFYSDLQRRLNEVPGVRGVTLSHASLIRAGRSHPTTVNGVATENTRIMWAGPAFFTTMQIPILRGREIGEGDRQGAPRVAVVSDLFARRNFGDRDPIGQHIEIGGSMRIGGVPVVLEVVGVAATARYGGLKNETPPVVYVPYAQLATSTLGAMTYAVRTDSDPQSFAGTVRRIVHDVDGRVAPINLKTQAADINQTINQEIVFARLCGAFAILALVIACVGLYATMAYAVARRTNEIGLRMALGAGRGNVIWMMLREVGVLAAIGMAIGVPTALGTSHLVESFLFGTKPNDPRAMMLAAIILVTATFVAGYGPARRAARVDPIIALRHE